MLIGLCETCFLEGFNNCNKQGMAILNIGYQDNANFILSSLLHLLDMTEPGPFARNLSLQFDNASNNKCNVAIGLFSYLILEEIFYNVSHFLSCMLYLAYLSRISTKLKIYHNFFPQILIHRQI